MSLTADLCGHLRKIDSNIYFRHMSTNTDRDESTGNADNRPELRTTSGQRFCNCIIPTTTFMARSFCYACMRRVAPPAERQTPDTSAVEEILGMKVHVDPALPPDTVIVVGRTVGKSWVGPPAERQTPITDANTCYWTDEFGDTFEVVRTTVAQDLERQLAEARELIERQRKELARLNRAESPRKREYHLKAEIQRLATYGNIVNAARGILDCGERESLIDAVVRVKREIAEARRRQGGPEVMDAVTVLDAINDLLSRAGITEGETAQRKVMALIEQRAEWEREAASWRETAGQRRKQFEQCREQLHKSREQLNVLKQALHQLAQPCTREDYKIGDLDRVVRHIANTALDSVKE